MTRILPPTDHRPPALPQTILSWIALPADRQVLLGDLHEEFASRTHRRSGRGARAWYWRQAALSMPYLLLQRLRAEGVRKMGITIFTTLAALAMIVAWDIWVARASVQYVASRADTPSLLVVRSLYFTIQMFGVALAGAAVAVLTFTRTRRFALNALYCLGPVIAALMLVSLFNLLAAEGGYPMGYLLIRLGLSIPALLLGAVIGSAVLSSRR